MQSRTALVCCCIVMIVIPAHAQAPQKPSTDVAAMLQFGFNEVSGWITKSAELVPADKFTYQPSKDVRTFGQQIAHVADSYGYYCGRAAGRNAEWSDAVEKGGTDKATLLAKLEKARLACEAVYKRGGLAPALMQNIAHTNLHYGNVITYMRMLGLKPPSS